MNMKKYNNNGEDHFQHQIQDKDEERDNGDGVKKTKMGTRMIKLRNSGEDREDVKHEHEGENKDEQDKEG